MKKLYSLLLIFISVTVFAQNYSFTTYNTNNSGIASNNVNDFKQSSSGTIWIATNNGLSAMVGNNFTNYRTNNSNIASNMLNKLAMAGTNVWATTPQQGLIYRNGNTGAFTNYTMSNSGIPNNVAKGIATDGLGNLWMASSSGLTKFNGTTWTTYNTTNSQIFSNDVTSVFTDASNNVWLSAGNALIKFNGTTFTIITDQVEKILKVVGTTIYVDTFDGFGTVVGTNYTGFHQVGSSSCLESCGVAAVGVDETNTVWLGLETCGNYSGGLQNFTECNIYRSSNSPLPDNNLTSIHVVDSNVIWAGTLEGGLVKLNKSDACNPPTNMAVNQQGLSYYGANLTWTAANPVPTGYTYYYNTVNTVGGTFGLTSDTNVWIDGLQPNTTYYWWVSSACTQNWVPGGSFTTLAAPVNTTCFVQVAAGGSHSLGIKADGTLWAWGSNALGQLGTGTGNQTTPKQVGTATNWQSVTAGVEHTIAIKTDGTMWGWGSNGNGRIGIGSQQGEIVTLPVQIGTATNWKSVKAGERHNVAVKTNGTLWAWGFNISGQLGDGTTSDKYAPTQIGTATNWQSVYAGAYHSFGIKNDNTLWGWGNNQLNQLGDGTNVSKTTPVQIGITNVQSIAAGGFHTIALKTTGSLWAWGANETGQVGDNTLVNRSTPVQIGTNNTWAAIGAGDQHSMGINTNGALYTWGKNTTGQLGHGGTANKLIPTVVNSNTNGWTAVTGGFDHTMAIGPNGALSVWGSNTSGQVGVTGFTQSNVPTSVGCPVSTSTCNPPTGLSVNTQELTATSVSLQWNAPTPAPTGYNFVYNTVNTIGGTDGYTQGTGAWISGLTPNTTYYWWVASACTPQQWVAGGSFTTPASTACFTQIASGAGFSAGIKADGSLWAWGSNFYGQIGNGNTTNQSQPSQVGTARNWKYVATGLNHTMAIKTDGTLWAWGTNLYGRLGTGASSANVLTPVQIGTATNWKHVAGGQDHTLAVKTDGTLWAWGRNNEGQIGDNTNNNRLTPVQIGSATNWASVYATRASSHAVTTDGTLWSWGYNVDGQLGVGGISNRLVPTVTTMTSVKAVAAGGFHVLALKTNGSLWAWGNSMYGQIGNGSTSNVSTPVQIGGSNSTWKTIGAGDNHSMAVSTGNLMLTWGQNNEGQLGNNSLVNKSVPTSANMDGVIAVTGGAIHTLILQEGGYLSVAGGNMNGQLATPQLTQTSVFVNINCPTSASLSNENFEIANVMKVYPNPVNDILNISLDREINSVTIYNLLGQQVIAKTVNANEAAVNVSELQSGTYFVKVTSGDQIKTSKIIKR